MAEGTPTELKRSLGNDVIIAQVDGQANQAREAVTDLVGVVGVETRGSEVLIQVTNGAVSHQRRCIGPGPAGGRR